MTKALARRHLRAMSAGQPLLSHLRRSVLGAWLAVAYALAVLATGLAPAPAHAAIDGAVLCSGLSVPMPEMPALADEARRCEGCPVGPVSALPLVSQVIAVARQARPVASTAAGSSGVVASPAWRLPPSHAPPQAAIF